MNDQARDSEPPDEPYYTSEQALLSPASPKPMQFPQPTNIPVLEKMMDVGFNQTGVHMGDPASRDTEVRSNAWREPTEQTNQNSTDYASPYSTGGEANNSAKDVDPAEPGQNDVATHSTVTALNGEQAQSDPAPLSHGLSHEPNSHVQAQVASDAAATGVPLPDPSVPTAGQQPTTTDAIPTQSNEVKSDQSQPTPIPGAVDVLALLENLQTSIAFPTATSVAPTAEPAADGSTVATTLSPSRSQAQRPIAGADASSPLSASALGAPPAGLPPRPPPQEQPLINPNYVHLQHLRDYHPHATHPAVQSHTRDNSSGNVDPKTTGYHVATSQQPNVFPMGQSSQIAGADQSVLHNQSSVPQQFSATTPIESRREYKIAAGQTPGTEDQPWTQDIQRKYDHFMEEERRYVNEARWDQFPMGSRLFVGNLSSEKVTKRDIFHVFHSYGDLAQISIKQAYGFVQFLRVQDCQRALEHEQGRQIRDKRIHLEVSKPQKNGGQQQKNNHRRSRSPDYGTRGKSGSNVDRYVSGSQASNGRGRDNGRDGYRPGYRSPSPREYRDNRYEERYRTRSRSPGYGRDRYRGGSPRREPEDDLPLPRRHARDVPDVQIIVLDALDRDFITWVEAAFTGRGVRVDVLILSPRLSEEAVVRRQMVEGVLAVSKLKMANQLSSKVGLTIFKRQDGKHDVQFEEYDKLDPTICVELVLREKQMLGVLPPSAPPSAGAYGGYPGQYGAQAAQPPQHQYGYQAQPQPPVSFPAPTGYPPGYGQSSAPYAQPGAHSGGPPPQMQQLNSIMDPNNLQNLLSTLKQTSPQTPQTAQYGTPTQQHAPGGFPPAVQHQQYGGQQYNPAMRPPTQQPQQQPGMPPAGGQPNMQDILARLGSYRQ